MLANAQKITFKHNPICKTHLEKLCRDTLRPGHSMKICCFKSHKLKVIFGHLLFNVFHSRGELRHGWNLSAISGVICKIKNGSQTLDLDELRRKESSELFIMIINENIICSCHWLRVRDLTFLPQPLPYSREYCL